MPRFAANLSMLYNEVPFLERFAAAASDGFAAVEFLFPYAWDAPRIGDLLQANHLQQVLLNAPAGGRNRSEMASAWDRGERGCGCIPGRESEFRAGVEQALHYAAALSCPRIHVMAGRLLEPTTAQEAVKTYTSNLQWAAQAAAEQGCEVLIEPINTRDIPAYFLT